MTCVVQSTGQMQCDPYDSMLALSSELKVAQVLIVASLLTGSLGLILAFIGGKCTRFLDDSGEIAKGRVATAAGVALIISAMLSLTPATWTAITVVQNFYNPQIHDAQRREIGLSIYIAWGASVLLLFGGSMLCSTSCCQRANNNSPSVKFKVVSSYRDGSSIRSSQQVWNQRGSQNENILVRTKGSDGSRVNQQSKTTSEESKKSKTSTIKSEESMIETDEPSTKSQLNCIGSNHSLGSTESEAASTCPAKTYI